MKILDKITVVLSELSGMKAISPECALQGDLGLDSLQMVMLLMMLEETFEIVLDESDMNPFLLISVMDVVSLVEKYTTKENDEENEKEN